MDRLSEFNPGSGPRSGDNGALGPRGFVEGWQFNEDQIELTRRSVAPGIAQIPRAPGRPNGESETLGIKKQTLDLEPKHRTASEKPGKLRNRVFGPEMSRKHRTARKTKGFGKQWAPGCVFQV